jgi:hypothetical protein
MSLIYRQQFRYFYQADISFISNPSLSVDFNVTNILGLQQYTTSSQTHSSKDKRLTHHVHQRIETGGPPLNPNAKTAWKIMRMKIGYCAPGAAARTRHLKEVGEPKQANQPTYHFQNHNKNEQNTAGCNSHRVQHPPICASPLTW